MLTYNTDLSSEFELENGTFQVEFKEYHDGSHFLVTTREYADIGGFFPRDRKQFTTKGKAVAEFNRRFKGLLDQLNLERLKRKQALI